jgi:xanthine dehydrogenase molybdopterin-binding subunit B
LIFLTGDTSVGKPVPPEDTVRKVTGTALYTFDWDLPGTLHAKLVTSTMANNEEINFRAGREMIMSTAPGCSLGGRVVGSS